eukprot:TRINITY_DN18888_c1_g1_i1.p1 TRINITY_DN18888_c1_g1~~TRINITY_DN18888_c1_g1_i1.p1  ORF type:complete len:284 (+),score=72.98 TRINITY_DN18888_c1_g1_i1:60-911(+)
MDPASAARAAGVAEPRVLREAGRLFRRSAGAALPSTTAAGAACVEVVCAGSGVKCDSAQLARLSGDPKHYQATVRRLHALFAAERPAARQPVGLPRLVRAHAHGLDHLELQTKAQRVLELYVKGANEAGKHVSPSAVAASDLAAGAALLLVAERLAMAASLPRAATPAQVASSCGAPTDKLERLARGMQLTGAVSVALDGISEGGGPQRRKAPAARKGDAPADWEARISAQLSRCRKRWRRAAGEEPAAKRPREAGPSSQGAGGGLPPSQSAEAPDGAQPVSA